jgi:titin
MAQVVGVVGGVRLTWQDNSMNETAWIVTDGVTQRSFTVPDGRTTGKVSYTWTGMSPGEYKCLHVDPYNQYGRGNGAPASPTYWACTTASVATAPAPEPTQLTAQGIPGGVSLSWRDNSRNETSWIVNDGVTNRYTPVAPGGSLGTVSFQWTGMASHEWKCFRVRAYNSWGTSGYAPPSGYVCAYSAGVAPPAAPSAVTTSFCYAGSLNLIWEENSSWDSFRVYRGGVLIKELSQNDSALQRSGPEYYYTVPAPISHVTVGVSAVRAGAASAIAYAGQPGETYTC